MAFFIGPLDESMQIAEVKREGVYSISMLYRAGVRRKWTLFLVLLLCIVAVAGFALSRGAYAVGFMALMDVLFGHAEGAARTVFLSIRLPRVCAALFCGWGLAVSGLVIQTLLKNPLGSASTLGISQGAAFGAALSIVVFRAGIQAVTAAAFLGAMATTVIILFLARIKQLTAKPSSWRVSHFPPCFHRLPSSFNMWRRKFNWPSSSSGLSGT